MKATDNLRRQHQEILQTARDITEMLETGIHAKDATGVRLKLARLAGVLNVHLAMEDGVLYPRLLESAEPRVRALAQGFVSEMGGLRRTFVAYMKRWSAPEAIQAKASDFALETRVLFDALARRIDKEDRELYPIADGAHDREEVDLPVLSPSPVVEMRELGADSLAKSPRRSSPPRYR